MGSREKPGSEEVGSCNEADVKTVGIQIYDVLLWIMRRVKGEVCGTADKMEQFYRVINRDKTTTIRTTIRTTKARKTRRTTIERTTTESSTIHTHDEFKSNVKLDLKSKIMLWITTCSVFVLFVVYATIFVYVKKTKRRLRIQKSG